MKRLENLKNNKIDTMNPSSSQNEQYESSETEELFNRLREKSKMSANRDFNITYSDDSIENQLLFSHSDQLKMFIDKNNLKFSKGFSIATKEQTNDLFSLINNVTDDIETMNDPNLFNENMYNGSRISQVFKNLSFALFVAYNTLQEKNQKYQNKLQDLQNNYDDLLLVSSQKNSSTSNQSDLNLDKEYCANNESLLKTMSTKFDELTDEMHKLSLKNQDQESIIEQLKQKKMDLELQIDLLGKQLKSSQESSQKSIVFNSNDNISSNAPSSNDDIVTSNARIFVLENDINTLNNRINELNTANEKKKEKIKLLVRIVKEKESKLQEAQRNLESIQIKYDQLCLENEEKDNRLKNIDKEIDSKMDVQSTRNEEIDNLNEALNQLSAQMQEMSDEIQLECKAKNSLLTITQEQQNLLSRQEQYIATLTDKIHDLEEKNNDIENHLKTVKTAEREINVNSNKPIKNLEEEIISILNENINNDQVLIQLNEDIKRQQSKRDDGENTILFIIQWLIGLISSFQSSRNDMNSDKSSRDQVQRLLHYISNLLHFLDQIANSSEVQEWIIGSNPQDKEAFRQDLLKQCSRIDSFLKQNYYYEYIEGNGALKENEEEEEAGIEFSMEDNDFLNVSEKVISQICDENRPLDEITVVFKMFASSNDFLRRFSEELKLQNDSLISDLHGIRNEINEQRNKEEQNGPVEPRKREVKFEGNNNRAAMQLYNCLRTIYQSLSSITKPRVTHDVNPKNADKNKDYSDDDDEYEYEYSTNLINNDEILQIQEMVKNCLDMINDTNPNLSQAPSKSKSKSKSQHEPPYVDDCMVKYISKLEKKVHKLEEINANLYQKIKDLKNANSKQKKQLQEEVEGTKKSNEDLSSTIIDKDKSLSELETLVDHKNEEINLLKKRIKENELKFAESVENLKKEMQYHQDESNGKLETFKNLSNNDIIRLKQDYDEKIQDLGQKMNDNKMQFKSDIKKLQAEYDAEVKRSDDLKSHFESLIIDLKNKLSESREREKSEKEEKMKADKFIADLKTELSKLRIENKMTSMKLHTTEEKCARERDLRITQNKMSIMKLESDKEREINEIKESTTMKFHKFLRQIFEIFDEFVLTADDGQKLSSRTISKENAVSLMRRVNEIAKQADRFSKENAEYQYELNEIKAILMIQDDINDDSNENESSGITKLRVDFVKIIQAIKELPSNSSPVSARSVSNKKLKQADFPQNKKVVPVTARDWEVWARRLHALATDSFCTMKPPKELQQAIEEEVVSAVGQRPLFRKVEILRSEKLLLQRGIAYVTNNELNERNIRTINYLAPIPYNLPNSACQRRTNPVQASLSIIQIIAVVVSVRRMQKISGHLKLFFGIGSKKIGQNQKSPVAGIRNARNGDVEQPPNDAKDSDLIPDINNDNQAAVRTMRSNDKKRYPILNFVD